MARRRENALDWGWKKSDWGLEPVTSEQEPIPRVLLNIILCGCTTQCSNACGCRKAGLKYSILCKLCCSETCTNVNVDAEDSDEDDEDDYNDLPTMVPYIELRHQKKGARHDPDNC